MADGIIFRTTDVIRWGAGGGLGTGGNLTPLQFDENMWELLTRIQAIENNPPEAISVEGFSVIGSQFQVDMSDGSTRGPYDLPVATFTDRGVWTNDLPLLVLDLISSPGYGLFLVKIAHTTPASPAVFDPAAIDEDSGSPTFGQPLYQLVFGENAYIFDIGFYMPGTPGLGIDVGEEMFAYTFGRAVSFPANLPGSIVKLKEACASNIDLSITKNGVEVGTANILSGEIEGTYTFAAAVAFAANDDLGVIRPASLDGSAKGLRMTILATRTDI